VLELIILANEYNCAGLIQLCEKEISHCIDVDTAFNLLHEDFCDIHNATQLKTLCLHVLAKEYDSSKKLPVTQLKDFNVLDNLVKTYYDVYNYKKSKFDKEILQWNKQRDKWYAARDGKHGCSVQ